MATTKKWLEKGGEKTPKKWWADLTLSTRCLKAMRAIDRADSPNFKNESLEDFKEIIAEDRLQMLRGVGAETEEEFCQVLGIKK